ncbi:MAG: hypothetical protein ACYTGX_18865, partial [Planctomycetota bacterium]
MTHRTTFSTGLLLAALLAGCQGGGTPAGEHDGDSDHDGGAPPAKAAVAAPAQDAPPAAPAQDAPAAAADHAGRPKGAEWTPEDFPKPLGAPNPDALKFPELTYDPPTASEHRHELPGGIACFVVEDHLLPMVDVTLRWKG